MKNIKGLFIRFSSLSTLRLCAIAFITLFYFYSIKAQSTEQSYPTPITTNQINGTIQPRDVGDSRLTNYFYVFGGQQGDIFVNVVTINLDGDIDIFIANGLKPLTKIKVYSDNTDNETGRIIYLRQSEKLILRVEGRSPNDEPATFQIKFAGSFLAEKASTENEKTDVPQVKNENESGVRVNSVGTIVEVKPTPQPVETPAKTETVTETKAEQTATVQPTEPTESKEVTGQNTQIQETIKKEEEKVAETEKPSVVVVITDNIETPKVEKAQEKTVENTSQEAAANETETKPEKTKTKTETKTEANPLENIKLVVIFKNGTKIERPMSEILRVNVDKGILTIIHKDGSEGRYSILDVAEMSIK